MAAKQQTNLVNLVIGASELDCNCPLCAELVRSGQPVHFIDENGDVVEGSVESPPMMKVRVIPRGNARDVLGSKKRYVEIPVGCVAGDLAEYLRYKALPLAVGTSFRARVNGEVLDPMQVLLPGDRVEIVVE